MKTITKVLRRANVLFFQQRKILHPTRNQYRTNYIKIMNCKKQSIATKSVFSYKKTKKYNIRAMHTEKNENTATPKVNTENVNQRTANKTKKSNVEETLKNTKEIEKSKIKEIGQTEIASDDNPNVAGNEIITFCLALLMILGGGIIMNIKKGTRKKYFSSFKSG